MHAGYFCDQYSVIRAVLLLVTLVISNRTVIAGYTRKLRLIRVLNQVDREYLELHACMQMNLVITNVPFLSSQFSFKMMVHLLVRGAYLPSPFCQ